MLEFDIFNISAQNIDCGYTLEPPHTFLQCKQYSDGQFVSRSRGRHQADSHNITFCGRINTCSYSKKKDLVGNLEDM